MSAKQRAFLAAFAACGNVTVACRLAKVCRSSHYEWMGEAEYAAAFATAQEVACELLEAEARRRAVEGVDEPVVYQGQLTYLAKMDRRTKQVKVDPETGKPVLSDRPLTIRKYSDVLLIFLLKGAKPEKYRDNVKVEHSGQVDLVERLAAGRRRLSKRGDGE